MNLTNLISKYGTKITLDNQNVKAFLDSEKSSMYKKHKFLSSFNVEVILTDREVSLESTATIKGKNYKVLEILDTPTIKDKLIYSEVSFYEDDFIHDIEFYKQKLSTTGCNLPTETQQSYTTAKARIKTKKPNDYLQYALQGAKVPTHTITIRYDESVNASDVIHYGDRRFEILTLENIDELNIFLELNCIEVLNA